MSASLIAILMIYPLLLGLWFGLMPYMLLRYRGCDLFGDGQYVKRKGR